jgi:hypothetical protein
MICNHGFQTSYRESYPTVINALLVTMVTQQKNLLKKTEFSYVTTVFKQVIESLNPTVINALLVTMILNNFIFIFKIDF